MRIAKKSRGIHILIWGITGLGPGFLLPKKSAVLERTRFLAIPKKGVFLVPTMLVPVVKEYRADTLTPISIFKVLRAKGACFLLESVEKGERWGRYSFIGLKPIGEVIVEQGQVRARGKIRGYGRAQKPLQALREIMQSYLIRDNEALPRFAGGMVGFLSYDLLRYYEKLPNQPEDDTGFPDAHLFMITQMIVYDHLRQKIQLIQFIPEKEANPDRQKQIRQEMDQLIMEVEKTSSPVELEQEGLSYQISRNFSRKEFIAAVKKVQEYIRDGDVFQTVLSQRITYRPAPDPFQVYRHLRSLNPSPYLYFLDFADYQIVGSSPECLVRMEGNQIETCPIAGTRPRGRTAQEDARLAKELLQDEKERAEHAMLVDLGRNDLGKVAELGTVRMEDYMHLEKYSHVMHLVTQLKGRLAPRYDAFDTLVACLPAGTVSGAPKLRAMEIIDQLEPTRRGPYAGAVGYFDLRGNMDTCITIRSLFFKDDSVYLQAGAGIVADSVPEKEYQEILNKLKALTKSLELEAKGEKVR